MKRILIISTGGTIACVSNAHGLRPEIGAEELVNYIPEAKDMCTIDLIDLYSIDSSNLQPEHWMELVGNIRSNYSAYDGFIITHGTDTMAYTAAALSYLIQNADKPVVITGAQKPISATDTDAKKNLLDSLRFVLTDHISGVYLVFGGQAIIGTRARKIRSKSFHAFESINYPVAAFLSGPQVLCYETKKDRRQPVFFCDKLNPRIFLLKLIPGMEPDILRYIGMHYDAIVIESYGVGGIPFQEERNFLPEIQRLAREGKIIVIATQVMLEGSDVGVYEVGYRAMEDGRILQTYDMTVEAAIVKLMWILGQTSDFTEIRKMFYQSIGADILTVPANT